ncbi:alpha-glucosidase [Pustulibacterium marinum]|uniref:Alpha-glucosidase n=1 Tax=Pustulibacterium marinum TaxID=1224947 RepID=A0A1I7H6Q6_9FLAO|nr:TIM-barrel domain-containing protein [Pustulibacterium marinum]SFU56400.1 alpha-glucosidase [Pustulibacterium marinum]
MNPYKKWSLQNHIQKFLFIILLMFIFLPKAVHAQKQAMKVVDYHQDAPDEITLEINTGAALNLTFLDDQTIRFWMDPKGVLTRKNSSFAVITETFQLDYQVNVIEHTSQYEIFTSALRVVIEKQPMQVQIFDKYQRLLLGDAFPGYTLEADGVHSHKVLRSDEHFFGLGEKSGSLDRRGKRFTMWNSDQPCYSGSTDPLYKSIPFFMSSYGYGIFLDNTYKTTFDFGKTDSNRFTFGAPDGSFVYYFMYGPTYKNILFSYTRLTGKPILPPNWAFGWAQSRGMLTNETLTRKIAEEYRKRKIPCDIIYQDIGWVDGLQNFEWRKDRYQNARKMLSDLREDGYKIIVSQDPVVSKATISQWKHADSLGYFVKDDRTDASYNMPWPWGGNAGVVDFTNPKVADWWGDLQQQVLDDGVQGFWTDMGEPAWSNMESIDRLHMKHMAGMHDEIHNVYGATWDRVVTEQFKKHNPNRRVFQMTRAAYAGLQRYTFGWSGDSGNGSEVTDGWRNLQGQIPLGLSAGLGLIPFWTTDISGYCGEITDYEAFSELYIRWLQFGIFNPLSRAHHEGDNAVEPWLFGDKVEQFARKAIELKYTLHPYLYTMARQSYDFGVPIMRPLFLDYPSDETTYTINDSFMWGDNFLVAPVVKEGQQTRQVYLPKGRWYEYPFSEGIIYKGGQTIEIPVTLGTIPMFVKAGSIIPKMPVMPYIGAEPNAPLIFEVFPDTKEARFELYEDDGVSLGYQKEQYRRTTVRCTPKEGFMELTISPEELGNYRPSEPRNYWIRIHLDTKPSKVYLNDQRLSRKKLTVSDFEKPGAKSAYTYDKDTHELWVCIPDQQHTLQQLKIDY